MEKKFGDMKQALTSGGRPKLSMIPRVALIYITRALEYGADKYARSNFYGAAPAGVSSAERVLGYIDATQRHLARVADNINRALGTGGDLAAAVGTVDADGGGKFPASNIPDLAHALASLAIGVLCAVNDGLLPEDPGQPWRAEMAPTTRAGDIPQKDDPAAEKARVAALSGVVTAIAGVGFPAGTPLVAVPAGTTLNPLPVTVTTEIR